MLLLFRCTTSWVKVLCWLRVWFVTAAFSQFPVVRFLLRISGQRTKTKEGRRKKESPRKKQLFSGCTITISVRLGTDRAI
uniref:Uncharacterized protein n=1 Tax=Ixodes scapularis TaxID=6945 RepID=A0A4D5RXM1_IXOSC